MSAKKYSNEQIKDFHTVYIKIGDQSLVSFAKDKRLSASALRCGFKRLNLEIIPQEITRRKFPINENFFEIINTEEKAYMLGFLYADGCNHEEHHKIEISLAKQDEDILIKFSKLLLNGNIQLKEYKTHKEHRVGLYLINQKLSDDLVKLGCAARKTFTLKFPDLPEYLQHHFIRGYFDGDGMLVIYDRIKPKCINKSTTAEFSIVSTKEMLDEIGKRFSDLGVNYKINKRHKDRDNNNFTLRVFGNQQIKKVCDYLYNNATLFLDRKQKTYLQLAEMSKTFRKEYKHV